MQSLIELKGKQRFSDFLRFWKWATTLQAEPLGSFSRGERVVIWGEADGLGGLGMVGNLLHRAKRRQQPLHVMISGGDSFVGTRDQLPAHRMLAALQGGYAQEFTDLYQTVSVDAFSWHTGHQGRILAAWLEAVGAKEVLVVLPIYHMPRFLLTLAQGIVSCCAAGTTPRFFPMPFGTWETEHSCKEPLAAGEHPDYAQVRGFTYAQLAFDELPRFHFEDTGAQNVCEVEKIVQGWTDPDSRICREMPVDQALRFFLLEK